jgi:hypothetical protein
MISLLLLALLQTQTAPAAQTAPAPAPAGPPQWTFRETKDEAKGTHAASATIRTAAGDARLVVRCDVVTESVMSVQFIPKPGLPAGEVRNVTVTLDGRNSDIAPWLMPGSGAVTSDPVLVYRLATEIAAAKKINVVLTSDTGKLVNGTFDGPGSDTLFRQVYAACGIPYAAPPPEAPAKPK